MRKPDGRAVADACADVLIDRIVKIEEGRYDGLSPVERDAELHVLELMLTRMGYHYGCAFRVQQESNETYVEQPAVADLVGYAPWPPEAAAESVPGEGEGGA